MYEAVTSGDSTMANISDLRENLISHYARNIMAEDKLQLWILMEVGFVLSEPS